MSPRVCNSYLWVFEFWVYPTSILALIATLSIQWSYLGNLLLWCYFRILDINLRLPMMKKSSSLGGWESKGKKTH